MDRGLNIPKVRDILNKKVIALETDFSVLDVVHIFNKFRISSAPVVNTEKEVVGYISEIDFLNCLGSCLFFDESRNPTIASIMATNVQHANSEWDIFELDKFFFNNHIRSAPVIDSGNHLAGIITRRDALRALEEIIKKRDGYKKEIKKPIDLSPSNRIKMILNGR